MVTVSGRFGYSVDVDQTSYNSNSILEGHNFERYSLAIDYYYYYNQKYSRGMDAYLVSKPMDTFEKHRKILHSPHLWL